MPAEIHVRCFLEDPPVTHAAGEVMRFIRSDGSAVGEESLAGMRRGLRVDLAGLIHVLGQLDEDSSRYVVKVVLHQSGSL